jgi:hypothetical protein
VKVHGSGKSTAIQLKFNSLVSVHKSDYLNRRRQFPVRQKYSRPTKVQQSRYNTAVWLEYSSLAIVQQPGFSTAVQIQHHSPHTVLYNSSDRVQPSAAASSLYVTQDTISAKEQPSPRLQYYSPEIVRQSATEKQVRESIPVLI